MKLTTNQVIDLFKALTELRGVPTPIEMPDGKTEIVFTPYPLSDRVKWCAAQNRSILKRLVVAHDEIMQDAKHDLNAFKKSQRENVDSEPDAKVKAEKLKKAQQIVQDRVDELNADMVKIGRTEQDVSGLRLMPAKGFCLKTSPIPPTIISELLVLIEGEPYFDDKDAATPSSGPAKPE